MWNHLTFQEREALYRLNKAKRPKAEIAATLGRDRSTIYRELRGNTGGRGYRPKQAQREANQRRLRCRRKTKMSNPKLKKYVTAALEKKWSPDEIAGRDRRTRSPDDRGRSSAGSPIARYRTRRSTPGWRAKHLNCECICVVAIADRSRKPEASWPVVSASKVVRRQLTRSVVTATGKATRSLAPADAAEW